MIKKIVLIAVLSVIIIGAIVLIASNLSKDETNNSRVKIIVSNFASYDFLRAITKDVEGVNIDYIIGAGKDIHSYDPSMQDIKEMNEADLMVYIGGELEAWADTVIPTLDNKDLKLVKISESVIVKEEQEIDGAEPHDHNHEHEHEHEEHEHEHEEHEHEHEEHEHEEHEHEHSEFDLHIWTSPENAKLMVKALMENMIEIDAENKDKYTVNGEAYIKEIEKIDNEIREIVNNASRKKIVFGDKMPMQYFIDYYDLDVSAVFAGCSTEAEPSTKTLTYLSDLVKNENIPVVIYTELNDGLIANTIVNEAGNGAKAMQIQTLHNLTFDNFNKGATYIDLMRTNIDVLKVALN